MAMMCFTVLMIALFIVLSLPQSHMRDLVKQIMTAVLCLIYVFSPIDFLPEIALGPAGLLDDLGAVFVGIASAKKAMKMSVGKG
jgi:uncharacterized membrane protein YkvA (DUF1232 family)